MKPVKINKKLHLNKVTVSNLNDEQMGAARGGLPQTVTCTQTCSQPTYCTCFSTCIVGCVAYTEDTYCGPTGNVCVTDTCTETYCGTTLP